MFNKTRIRLTALNAVVFFIIIALIGVIVYSELRHQLYAKVDESLQLRIQQDSQLMFAKVQLFAQNEMSRTDGNTKKTLIQVQGIDPRAFLVMWDDKENPYPILAGAQNRKTIDAFKPYRSILKPQTIHVDGHSYRIYATKYEQPIAMNQQMLTDIAQVSQRTIQTHVSSSPASNIVSVQAISLIDSEQNMLKQLLKLILFGIFGGGAVTVLAGLYLANQALLPIKRSWDKQQQFVADASHELRMPLSIIQANTELVFRHPDRSILDMSEPLSMVHAESLRMGRLTAQLLTLARADSNQEEMSLKPVQLNEIVREVGRKFESVAELKGQALVLKIEERLEILGDAERLHQLLVILLDNSMKFTTDSGKIRLIARKRGSHAEIVVEDTGSGIDSHDLPHIFDRFYRGDKARSRNSGGAGLGLAIAKWIVSAHSGTILADSRLGKGTTMTLHFPLEPRKS
ncbi:sensor histidine kinase [Paenibacillus planticolens]|uniref:histidine kinase n=1 Tax=Paenibacillus planticolens TaxID=2654976 RepID=A0ABX1ZU58_9BACL|nr:ATP-binding protein [Paenibacillus planticolens]NOV02175.1 hypothetical protein [Paenibacillus planticolens]